MPSLVSITHLPHPLTSWRGQGDQYPELLENITSNYEKSIENDETYDERGKCYPYMGGKWKEHKLSARGPGYQI